MNIAAVEYLRTEGIALVVVVVAFSSALVFTTPLELRDNKLYLRWSSRTAPLPHRAVMVVFVIYSTAIWMCLFEWLAS